MAKSPVEVVSLDAGGDFGLSLVSIVEQLLIVVQQLLRCLSRELKVARHDGIKKVGLLIETTADIFCHCHSMWSGGCHWLLALPVQ